MPRKSFNAHFSDNDPARLYHEEKRRAELRRKMREHGKVEEKICTKCYHTKPASQFAESKITLDGKASWCSDCRAAYMRNLRSARRQAGMT